MSDKQEQCGYPVMDCALGVYVTKCEDRIEELEAENKRLNEQMDVIEEMGTESLNSLPDCLMRLAPALDEAVGSLDAIATYREQCHQYDADIGHALRDFDIEDVRLMEWQARATLAKLKGEIDE